MPKEGAHVERTSSYLVADLLGGFELWQFQWRGNIGEDIPVEGFLHWVTDELGRFSSLQRATKEEGTPQFGHLFLWFLWQGSR